MCTTSVACHSNGEELGRCDPAGLTGGSGGEPGARVPGWDLSLLPSMGRRWAFANAGRRGGWVGTLASGPQSFRLHDLVPCCSNAAGARSNRPAFMTPGTVCARATHAVFCLLSPIHARTPARRVLIPLRGRAYIRPSSLFAGVPPNRRPGCLTWTGFTDFFFFF